MECGYYLISPHVLVRRQARDRPGAAASRSRKVSRRSADRKGTSFVAHLCRVRSGLGQTFAEHGEECQDMLRAAFRPHIDVIGVVDEHEPARPSYGGE